MDTVTDSDASARDMTLKSVTVMYVSVRRYGSGGVTLRDVSQKGVSVGDVTVRWYDSGGHVSEGCVSEWWQFCFFIL